MFNIKNAKFWPKLHYYRGCLLVNLQNHNNLKETLLHLLSVCHIVTKKHCGFCSIYKESHLNQVLVHLFFLRLMNYSTRGFVPSFSFPYRPSSSSCPTFKLQLLVVMVHPSRPEHNDKPDAEQWIDDSWKLFQALDLIFVVLLQFFISVIFLKCLFLLLLIDIDKFSPPEAQFDVLVNFDITRFHLILPVPSQKPSKAVIEW